MPISGSRRHRRHLLPRGLLHRLLRNLLLRYLLLWHRLALYRLLHGSGWERRLRRPGLLREGRLGERLLRNLLLRERL